MFPKMKEEHKIEILKDLLFAEEHAFEEKIAARLEVLEKIVNEKEKLGEKVSPLIKLQIEEFKSSLPETLGPLITKTLKEEVEINKDKVVDALFPILGKMVKKYVAQEVKLLSEKMNNQFSFFTFWKRKMRSAVTGEDEGNMLADNLAAAKIEQVFLIEKDSGILKASFSKTKTIDEEMVSGMLTAIKSFVEDAFNQQDQKLELIEYELYQLHLQSFATHYVAVAVSGNFNLTAKDKLQDIIFDFYNSYMAMNLDLVFKTKNNTKSIVPANKSQIEKEVVKYFGNAKL